MQIQWFAEKNPMSFRFIIVDSPQRQSQFIPLHHKYWSDIMGWDCHEFVPKRPKTHYTVSHSLSFPSIPFPLKWSHNSPWNGHPCSKNIKSWQYIVFVIWIRCQKKVFMSVYLTIPFALNGLYLLLSLYLRVSSWLWDFFQPKRLCP